MILAMPDGHGAFTGALLDDALLTPEVWREALSLGDPDDVARASFFARLLLATGAFSHALAAAGIPHRHELHAGGHMDRLPERYLRRVLPFMAAALGAAGHPPR